MGDFTIHVNDWPYLVRPSIHISGKKTFYVEVEGEEIAFVQHKEGIMIVPEDPEAKIDSLLILQIAEKIQEYVRTRSQGPE